MSNPIDALLQNDPASFRDSLGDILGQKLSDRLELERLNTAAEFFGMNENPGDDDDNIEYVDDDNTSEDDDSFTEEGDANDD